MSEIITRLRVRYDPDIIWLGDEVLIALMPLGVEAGHHHCPWIPLHKVLIEALGQFTLEFFTQPSRHWFKLHVAEEDEFSMLLSVCITF